MAMIDNLRRALERGEFESKFTAKAWAVKYQEKITLPSGETLDEFITARFVGKKLVVLKIDIRRALRGVGREAELDALLANSDVFYREWLDVSDIDFSDPLTISAITAAGIEENELRDIVTGYLDSLQ